MVNRELRITKVIKIGTRGMLFIFRELEGMEANVYVINGPKHVFVIDTFLGPKSMDAVKKLMGRALRKKPVVIVNSHYHWDHIWGNCAFRTGKTKKYEKGQYRQTHEQNLKVMQMFGNK